MQLALREGGNAEGSPPRGVDMRVARVLAIVVLAAAGVTACVKPPPPPPPVTFADLDGSFTGTSDIPGSAPCPNIRNQDFDAEYTVRNAAREVELHIQGCADPGTERYFGATFTIDTDVGTILGTASGSMVGTSAGFQYELELTATSGTGQFKTERGTADVSILWTTIALGTTPITGSLTAD
jgi:hypothetical protein